jgi:O-antigen ligase
MFYCLFLTFSTTGFFVFVIINVLLNHKFFSPKRILLVFLLIVVFYTALLNIDRLTDSLNLRPHQQMKIDNIVNILTLNTSEIDDSGRNDLVANLFNYIHENPFIGNGIDFAISKHGHNTIVGVWADAGIFTLLIFLIMLISYFKNSIIAPPNIRFFTLPIILTICVFMITLQSVINQPYLMALFIYIGYVIDEKVLV